LHPPVIVVALNGGMPDEAFVEAETVIRAIDEESIQRGVMEALRIPAIQMTQTTTESAALTTPEAHLEELHTLFALGRSLTEVLNLSEVLNRVVEAARRLTNAEEGMILLPDGDAGQLMLRAKVGIDVEVARNFRVKTQDTLAGTVFSGGQPLLIGEQGPQKVKTEYFVNSLVYVPILLKGKPIGVLGVNNKNKHDVFNSRHQELLLNLASYAAIAIENARIHEESLKQARELKALVDASQVINSSVALDQTLPNICEQSNGLAGGPRAADRTIPAACASRRARRGSPGAGAPQLDLGHGRRGQPQAVGRSRDFGTARERKQRDHRRCAAVLHPSAVPTTDE
jgi:GAF domain-containing protein